MRPAHCPRRPRRDNSRSNSGITFCLEQLALCIAQLVRHEPNRTSSTAMQERPTTPLYVSYHNPPIKRSPPSENELSLVWACHGLTISSNAALSLITRFDPLS